MMYIHNGNLSDNNLEMLVSDTGSFLFRLNSQIVKHFIFSHFTVVEYS